MAPVNPAAQQNGGGKIKKPPPPGIQTNGVISSKSSPSPSMSAKKPPPSAKQQPNSASDRSITASTVRPVNRARRENSTHIPVRNSRNSAGVRTGSLSGDVGVQDDGPPPYVVTDSYILKKYAGNPPSLVVHMHPTHFRFDGQDGMFQYKSPMKIFLEHVRSRTVPHDLLEYFIQANVPFYDGCLIVQVHDRKTIAQVKDIARPTSASSTVVASSIHNYHQWLTPSPYVPYPQDDSNSTDATRPTKSEEVQKKETPAEAKDKEMPAPSLPSELAKAKALAKPKVFTIVLHPTPESLQMDLAIKAATPRGAADGRVDQSGVPSTPLSLVPPTPTATNMPPPVKRQKREKTEIDGSNIYAAEGQILLATTAPLLLEPTKSKEETIVLLEAMAHPKHSGPPPQPKMRKRTVAEMAADEAAAADQERYMLVLDERLSSGGTGAQGAGGTDGDAQTGSSTFEPRFERFKVIEDIKREHAEKKEQEKLKQQENDRRLQIQRQQHQEQLALAQKQAEAERVRREAAQREVQARQAEAQRAAMAARAAPTPAAQNNHQSNMAQVQHAHPTQSAVIQNGMANGATAGVAQNAMPNGMPGGPQARFQAQMSQAPVSSPVVRQGTPQNMSSPMVGSSAMQQTNSGMAASPPRPSSVVQNPQMSVPMSHNMSARGSQQSHPSGTPRMPHSTPNMAHGTPINRPTMAATPRMSQASPPPNMMAQNSQMGQQMMMNNQGMNQHSPQVIAQMAAQQRAIAQQQQHLAAMQNGGANNAMNGQGLTPQQQQQQQQQMMQMMQRQMMMQQQQQQQQQNGMMSPQQQQQLAQQYAQQLQNMQGNQMRQMTPQVQAQIQQMARMGQLGGQVGNPMQRQVSGQMMNGNNPNMQALAMQMQLQQQQQQNQQQQHHPQTPQQPQQMGAVNPIQVQIQTNARAIYNRLLQGAIAKFGSAENVPPETMEKIKQTSMGQAQQMMQQSLAQRRAQHQMLVQQQQQQQQQAAMQGMGGMMGPQGM